MKLPIDTFENFVLGMDRVEVVFGYPDQVQAFLADVCAAVQERVYDDRESPRHFEVTFEPRPEALPDLHRQYGPCHNAVCVLSVAIRQGLLARGWPLDAFRIYFNQEQGVLIAEGRVQDLMEG